MTNDSNTISTMIPANGFWDKTGVVFSWLCALHCLAAPFMAVALPLVGLSFLGDETTEYFFIGLSFIIGVVALVPAFINRHRKVRVLVYFAAGLSLLILADRFFEDFISAKIFVVALGAGLISTAHLVNRRLCCQGAVCRQK